MSDIVSPREAISISIITPSQTPSFPSEPQIDLEQPIPIKGNSTPDDLMLDEISQEMNRLFVLHPELIDRVFDLQGVF